MPLVTEADREVSSEISLLTAVGATFCFCNPSQLARSDTLRFGASNQRLSINGDLAVAVNHLLPTTAALPKAVQDMHVLNARLLTLRWCR